MKEVSLLTGQLKVNLQTSDEGVLTVYQKEDVRPVRGEARQGARKDAPKAPAAEERD